MTISPEQLAKSGSEHGHQVALFCQANRHIEQWPELKWMFAIPKGGERNPIVAANLKAEGVKSGVSDICLPCARKGYHGFFIEMKKPSVKPKKSTSKGAASDNQLEFGAAVTENGYLFCVCYDWTEAWGRICWYMGE